MLLLPQKTVHACSQLCPSQPPPSLGLTSRVFTILGTLPTRFHFTRDPLQSVASLNAITTGT